MDGREIVVHELTGQLIQSLSVCTEIIKEVHFEPLTTTDWMHISFTLRCWWVGLERKEWRPPHRLGHISPILIDHVGGMDYDLSKIIVTKADDHFGVMRAVGIGYVRWNQFNV